MGGDSRRFVIEDVSDAYVETLLVGDSLVLVAIIPEGSLEVANKQLLNSWHDYLGVGSRSEDKLAYATAGKYVPLIEEEEKEVELVEYVAMSQADDPPMWYVEAGKPIRVTLRDRMVVANQEGLKATIIKPDSVEADFIPDVEDLIEPVDNSDWVSIQEEYWECMSRLYSKTAPISTISSAKYLVDV
jgi:hypothetical protein